MTQEFGAMRDHATMEYTEFQDKDRYSQKMNALFADWKRQHGYVSENVEYSMVPMEIDHSSNVFIRDGVICPEQWFSSSQEVCPLFLLKEAYGGDKDWDLVQDRLMSQEKIKKMWNRISHWTYGLAATTADCIAPYISDLPVGHFGNTYLRQAAAVNIRKSGGGKNSSMDVIRSYAAFDAKRLLEQLQLCDPTVIVCCYTGSALDIIWKETTGSVVRTPYNENLYYTIRLNQRDVLVLDYWHPANHYPDIMNYYSLMAIYQMALKDR